MKHYFNLSTPIDISDFLISAAGALSDALATDPELSGDAQAVDEGLIFHHIACCTEM